jgi:hypothetical protein
MTTARLSVVQYIRAKYYEWSSESMEFRTLSIIQYSNNWVLYTMAEKF